MSTEADTTPAQQVIDTCESEFDAHSNDCSGFAKAVAKDLGIDLSGLADDICDQIQGSDWNQLTDGVAAKQMADAGYFVIGGLKGADNVPPQTHGHVVVVVSGPLAHDKYPSAYWGKLNGVGSKDQTVNYAWNQASRDLVIYAAKALS